MTFAERGRGVAEHALFAFGGSPGSVEERVGYAGEGGDNDDGPRVLLLRDRDGVGDCVCVGEGRAAELMNSYGRHGNRE